MMSLTQGVLAVIALVVGMSQADALNGTSHTADLMDPTVYERPLDDTSNVQLRRIPKPLETDHYYQGKKDADVTLIEYIDLECPFCKRNRPNMEKIVKHYDGKVNWVVRHYPLAFHTYAKNEAEASECVAELGGEEAFWKYTDSIFQQTNSGGKGLNPSRLDSIAKQQGINADEFKKCMDSDRHLPKIQQQFDVGTKGGVNGTPTIIIITKDGRRGVIYGSHPYEEMKKSIDPFLGKGILDLEDPDNSTVL